MKNRLWGLMLALLVIGTSAFAQELTSDGIPDTVKELVAAPTLTMNLWPGTPPGGIPAGIGDEEWIPGDETPPIVRVGKVSIPTLALYKAENPNGACVVIFPGGGYSILAYNHEGTEIAQWLNGIGVSAVVVKYRVPRREGLAKHFAPLQDAQRAIRLVRANAADWGIDPARIGVLGFSAGGHLTVMSATQYNVSVYEPLDRFDEISARPDFAIPIYPAYMMDDEKETRADIPLSDSVVIDGNTPPMFVSVADRDANRAAAAARLFTRLYEAGVPAEIHIVCGTSHGYGIRPDRGRPAQWNLPCAQWMEETGLLNRPAVK
ncbi:MAG: alpha/beta hydrolase [Thermoguttaceae bacterium]|nr:alpha/beta hydrolase [Thermoguttaceae bacterium]